MELVRSAQNIKDLNKMEQFVVLINVLFFKLFTLMVRVKIAQVMKNLKMKEEHVDQISVRQTRNFLLMDLVKSVHQRQD